MAFFKKQTKQNNIERELDPSNFTSIHTAIGFSVFGLLGALIFSVVVGNDADKLAGLFPGDADQAVGVDRTIVGSISKKGSKKGKVKRYTVRQSVLQQSPGEPCIILVDGTQKGSC